jgi:tetratricopeptide (TPR) repeat protein
VRCLAGLIAVAGFAWTSPTDWVRRGNDAFRAGAFEQALANYAQAEGRHADPGLVAFNRAGAAFAAGQYELASAEYQRTLEDAQDLRRVRALYGQGNAQLQIGAQQRGRTAVTTLKQAVKSYEDCLAAGASDGTATIAIHDDARHNLQLALSLLKTKEAEQADEPPAPPDEPNQGPGSNVDGSARPVGVGEAGRDRQPGDERTQPGAETNGQATDKANAGKGNLRPLPDNVDGPPLEAQLAQAYLEQHLDRMRRDRLRQAAAPSTQRNARDW